MSQSVNNAATDTVKSGIYAAEYVLNLRWSLANASLTTAVGVLSRNSQVPEMQREWVQETCLARHRSKLATSRPPLPQPPRKPR